MDPATRLALAVVAFAFAGCADRSEFATISFSGGIPAQIDTSCSGECAQSVEAELSLESSESLPEDATVEILQFRIDYELAGVPADAMPFFADEISLKVAKGDSASFTIPPSGEDQRSWAIEQFTGEDLAGQAKLTLAGYDDLNETVEISARFDVRFADVGLSDDPEGDGGEPE